MTAGTRSKGRGDQVSPGLPRPGAGRLPGARLHARGQPRLRLVCRHRPLGGWLKKARLAARSETLLSRRRPDDVLEFDELWSFVRRRRRTRSGSGWPCAAGRARSSPSPSATAAEVTCQRPVAAGPARLPAAAVLHGLLGRLRQGDPDEQHQATDKGGADATMSSARTYAAAAPGPVRAPDALFSKSADAQGLPGPSAITTGGRRHATTTEIRPLPTLTQEVYDSKVPKSPVSARVENLQKRAELRWESSQKRPFLKGEDVHIGQYKAVMLDQGFRRTASHRSYRKPFRSLPRSCASVGKRPSPTVQPNVNAKASTPGSRNVISNVRSTTGFALPDQLIQPRLDHRAVALGVDVTPVGCDGRPPVDGARGIAPAVPRAAGPMTR